MTTVTLAKLYAYIEEQAQREESAPHLDQSPSRAFLVKLRHVERLAQHAEDMSELLDSVKYYRARADRFEPKDVALAGPSVGEFMTDAAQPPDAFRQGKLAVERAARKQAAAARNKKRRPSRRTK